MSCCARSTANALVRAVPWRRRPAGHQIFRCAADLVESGSSGGRQGLAPMKAPWQPKQARRSLLLGAHVCRGRGRRGVAPQEALVHQSHASIPCWPADASSQHSVGRKRAAMFDGISLRRGKGRRGVAPKKALVPTDQEHKGRKQVAAAPTGSDAEAEDAAGAPKLRRCVLLVLMILCTQSCS